MRQLLEADNLIHGDRNSDYGDASEDFLGTARYWSVYLSIRYGLPIELDDKDVAMMMTLLKIRREQMKHKRDNIVDGCGYLALAGELEGEDKDEGEVSDLDPIGPIYGWVCSKCGRSNAPSVSACPCHFIYSFHITTNPTGGDAQG